MKCVFAQTILDISTAAPHVRPENTRSQKVLSYLNGRFSAIFDANVFMFMKRREWERKDSSELSSVGMEVDLDKAGL